MWPFSRRQPLEETRADTRTPYKRLDDLELELIELRDSQEKTLAAIKRIQGRLMKRVAVAEGEEASQEAPGAPNGIPQAITTNPGNSKAALFARANQLRAMR